MHLHGLLHGLTARTCITCPDTPPCNCNADEICTQTVANCNACATNVCKPVPSTGGGSSGPPSTLIGAVIGVLVVVALVAAGVLWYRRRLRLKALALEPVQIKDVPAPAEAVLSRPDPSEKATSVISNPPVEPSRRIYSIEGTIDLDPESDSRPRPPARRASSHSNPFEDARSFMTTSTSTHGTNIIPIELVPAGSNSAQHSPTTQDYNRSSYSSVPSRPPRSPELTLNDGGPSYFPEGQGQGVARSQISGISRNSYNSYASYASDFLNESPTIVTARQGVRQVLGVGKAELVRTPSLSSSNTPTTITSATSRPPVRSPLANSSFGPTDALREDEDDRSDLQDRSMRSQSDPFRDNSPGSPQSMVGQQTNSQYPPTPHTGDSTRSDWTQNAQRDSGTTIGPPTSVADAARATSGYLNPETPNMGPHSGISTPGNVRSPYDSQAQRGNFEIQQQNALLQANAQQPGIGKNRGSMATNASGMSNADTILEAFPFVPPSPISALPSRAGIPPVPKIPITEATPLQSPNVLTPTPTSPLDNELTVPNTAGGAMTGASNASSGLSPFTFDIPPTPDTATPTTGTGSSPSRPRRAAGRPPVSNASLLAPTSATGSTYSDGQPASPRKRSSLDTLALLSDLSSYPLGFDKKK